MRHWIVLLLILPPTAAQAQTPAITIDDLQGVTIITEVTYSGVFRNDLGQAPGVNVVRMEIRIGPGDGIRHSSVLTATRETPAGTRTSTVRRSGDGKIGTPSEAKDKSGAGLWLLDGDALVGLRTFETGALAYRIALKKAGAGLTCSVSAPIMRELGAGNFKDKSSFEGGGKFQIVSIKQTGSSCRVVKR